ncbi:hypothetical protein SMD11_6936 [Streptomyces albireticuli]|uniref:Terpene synthase n=1 Tax=Streptomyces albireticuli TaxID=1940 RepID=A0A1Z2LDZ7_9ACTN|nr:hypothetical protein [Streptomyces albireticuli]ARZ72512.1 hypothetical protein SMD11_6936 [Streptomyces albireticuli]
MRKLSDIVLPAGSVLNASSLTTSIPHRVHEQADELEHACAQWARPYLLRYLRSEDKTEAYLRQRLTLWGLLCYPDTPADRAFNLMTTMVVTTLVDDTFNDPQVRGDKQRAELLRDAYLKVLDGSPPPPSSPVLESLHDSLAVVLPQMSPGVARRYLQSWKDVIDGCAQDADTRHADRILDWEEYRKIRLADLFGYWAVINIEYSLQADVSAYLGPGTPVQRVTDLAIWHMVLVNDVYSFPKEYELREPMNSMWILLGREEKSIGEALERIRTLLADTEQEFVHLCDNLSRKEAVIARYLGGLRHMVGGNHEFHRITSRYQDRGYVWTGHRGHTLRLS